MHKSNTSGIELPYSVTFKRLDDFCRPFSALTVQGELGLPDAGSPSIQSLQFRDGRALLRPEMISGEQMPSAAFLPPAALNSGRPPRGDNHPRRFTAVALLASALPPFFLPSSV